MDELAYRHQRTEELSAECLEACTPILAKIAHIKKWSAGFRYAIAYDNETGNFAIYEVIPEAERRAIESYTRMAETITASYRERLRAEFPQIGS